MGYINGQHAGKNSEIMMKIILFDKFHSEEEKMYSPVSFLNGQNFPVNMI